MIADSHNYLINTHYLEKGLNFYRKIRPKTVSEYFTVTVFENRTFSAKLRTETICY